jgi:hypothetical protein
MKHSLEEQISYMREQYLYFFGHGKVNDAEFCSSVIETLEKEVEPLRRENKVLQLKANASLSNNLCPDHRDKQNGKGCLACEIETLLGILDERKC